MNDDLIKRLTTKAQMIELGERIAWGSETSLMHEAAAALSEAHATIARLEAALRPFAQEHAWSPHSRFKIVLAGPEGDITGSDLDRARAALSPREGEG